MQKVCKLFGSYRNLSYLCSVKIRNKILEATGMIQQKRTREEILAWLDRARQRKLAWEKRMHERWAEEERLRKAAEISDYCH